MFLWHFLYSMVKFYSWFKFSFVLWDLYFSFEFDRYLLSTELNFHWTYYLILTLVRWSFSDLKIIPFYVRIGNSRFWHWECIPSQRLILFYWLLWRKLSLFTFHTNRKVQRLSLQPQTVSLTTRDYFTNLVSDFYVLPHPGFTGLHIT